LKQFLCGNSYDYPDYDHIDIFSILFSSKLFKIGILSYGKRPSVKELIDDKGKVNWRMNASGMWFLTPQKCHNSIGFFNFIPLPSP